MKIKKTDDALAGLFKKVRRVEIKSKHMSRQLFSGEYHSAFKGKGMSFAEVRPYQYGDDIRFIEWNVTARYREPYVKVFEEERELTIILMIDMSRSDIFGTVKMTKHELVTELSAVLAISADTNNDKVGAVFFTDKIEHFVPARKGRSHVLRIIRELIDFEPASKGTDIAGALNFIAKAVKRKSIVFMISDFLDRNYEKELGIAARKHDLIGVHVYDLAEMELPNAGLVLVKNPETGDTYWMDTSSTRTKTVYKAAFLSKKHYFEQAFQKTGADKISIRTDQPYLPVLHELFKKTRIETMHSFSKYFFISIILVLFNAKTISAQEISAESFAKIKDYLVGDRITVSLIVKRPENFSVQWKKQDPDPTRLELVDSIVKDSAKQSGFEKIDILLPLAGFDSGTAVYPAQLFVFRKHGDTASFTLKTKPITFHISSITVDLKKDIKPIVDPVEPGPDWKIIILYIIAGLVIIALIAVGYLLWRKYNRKQIEPEIIQTEIKRPSWEIAVEKLAQLQKDDFPGKGQVKEYYILLSHILKEFVSDKLNIDGLELTTEELADILTHRMVKAKNKEILINILELSDSVKFAKYIPDTTDHEKSIKMAYDFVEGMREGKETR